MQLNLLLSFTNVLNNHLSSCWLFKYNSNELDASIYTNIFIIMSYITEKMKVLITLYMLYIGLLLLCSITNVFQSPIGRNWLLFHGNMKNKAEFHFYMKIINLVYDLK